jgi:hypothetical protein
MITIPIREMEASLSLSSEMMVGKPLPLSRGERGAERTPGGPGEGEGPAREPSRVGKFQLAPTSR